MSDAASLNSVTEANQQKPLLGLFADGNMPVRWQGPKATYHGNIDKPAVTCTAGEWQGKTLREQAQARGYQLVSDAASLNSVTEANQQKPLLGLFADGNMPVRWQGPKATYHGNIDKPAVTCTPNPQRNDSVPTLAQMTDKAIELLSKNEKGFFLQVEGASIDKQDHAANPCGESLWANWRDGRSR